MTHFSLSWDAHKSSICAGLSALQQNGEFVDMTLAADGHHVKVHQMVLSLASPYIKDIISSTQCQHPVIFLNKVSYATLCAILEYIYTGEVLVAQENLNDFTTAAKELHIKGLQNMNIDITAKRNSDGLQVAGCNEGHQLSASSHCTFQDVDITAKSGTDRSQPARFSEGRQLRHTSQHKDPEQIPVSKAKTKTQQQNNEAQENQEIETDFFSDNVNDDTDEIMDITDKHTAENVTSSSTVKDGARVQYTLSNQGAVQLLLNRYLYGVSYTSTRDRHVKRWRCINSRLTRCLAVVFTKGDVVVRRRSAHNHPFHDKKILKKIRDNAVFSAIIEAENAKLNNSQFKKTNENV